MQGEDYEWSVHQLEVGNADAVTFQRISMDWFEQPMPQDAVRFPVRVVTDGVFGVASDLPSPDYAEVLSVSSTTSELGSVLEVTANLLSLNDFVVALGGDAAICGDLVVISQGNEPFWLKSFSLQHSAFVDTG